jgi:hypothetical protein
MSADSQGSDAEDVKGTLGEKREKRTSRACLTCRKRKSACSLLVSPSFASNGPAFFRVFLARSAMQDLGKCLQASGRSLPGFTGTGVFVVY